jgi:hypothetical protein
MVKKQKEAPAPFTIAAIAGSDRTAHRRIDVVIRGPDRFAIFLRIFFTGFQELFVDRRVVVKLTRARVIFSARNGNECCKNGNEGQFFHRFKLKG